MPRINVKDKRRQQLIEANIASIARRGYAETTIAHVSKGAGMSRGIVNFYFLTKEKMMLETLAFVAGEYLAVTQEALAASQPAKKLEALVSAHFDPRLMAPKRLAVWAAFWGHAATHGDYRKIIAETDEAQKKRIADLWTEAGGAKDRAEGVAAEIYGMIRGFWLGALISGSRTADVWSRQCCEAVTLRLTGAAPAEKPARKLPRATVLPASRPAAPRRPAADEGQMHLDDLFSRVAPK